MYASFRRVRGLGYMTVPEMLETMHENDQFDMFAVFSNVVHMLGVIPATLCSAQRSFSALHSLKTYLRSTLGNSVIIIFYLFIYFYLNTVNLSDKIIIIKKLQSTLIYINMI